MRALKGMIDFFFQAEDGIRDGHVTGVQTCALPICDGRCVLPEWLGCAIQFTSVPGRTSCRRTVCTEERRRDGADPETDGKRSRWRGIPPRKDMGDRLLTDEQRLGEDRKSTRLNSSHVASAYAGFCLEKKELVRWS